MERAVCASAPLRDRCVVVVLCWVAMAEIAQLTVHCPDITDIAGFVNTGAEIPATLT